jgi:hypothetical protein
MKLTEQAKKRFERWFVLTEFPMPIITPMQTAIQDFYDLPDSMKFGVYVDFFDFEEVFITINCENFDRYQIEVWQLHIEGWFEDEKETRHEARTKAIEKANELLNQKLEIG